MPMRNTVLCATLLALLAVPAQAANAPTAATAAPAATATQAAGTQASPAEPEALVVPTTRNECEAKGGFWSDYAEGRGRIWGCVMDTADVNKVCTDGSQCQSRYCVVYSAYCDGKYIENPRGSGLENCTFNGSCYGKTFPPKGCFGFLDKGQYRTWCSD